MEQFPFLAERKLYFALPPEMRKVELVVFVLEMEKRKKFSVERNTADFWATAANVKAGVFQLITSNLAYKNM